jgi:hypothetical protein
VLRGVIGATTAQTEEEDGNQLAGQVSDGSVAGNTASSQSLVVGSEWRGQLPPRDLPDRGHVHGDGIGARRRGWDRDNHEHVDRSLTGRAGGA